MRFTARPVLLAALTAAVFLTGVAAAPAARADAAFDRVVDQGKAQQDGLLQAEAQKARGNKQAFLAGLAQVVERYRATMRTQGSALSHYLFGRVLFKLSEQEGHSDGRRKQEALQALDSALAREPRLWQAKYAQAYIHLTTGDAARGEAQLKDLMRTHADRPEVLTLQGQLLLLQQRFRELKEVAERLLKDNQNNMVARNLLALAYMGLREWARAEAVVRSMIARGADDIAVRLRLVECLMGQSKFDEAEREVVGLIQKEPKSVELRLVYVDLLVARENPKRAIDVMRQVVDTFPDNIGYRGRLAELYLQTDQAAQAERILRRALDLCAGTDERSKTMRPFVLRTLAFALSSQAKHAEAVGLLEELDRLVDGDLPPHILDLMQMAYAKLERRAELLATLKRMRPHMKGRPEDLAKLEAAIARLESGAAAGTGQELWGRSQLVELLGRIQSPDVKTRRQALFQYYERNLDFVDPPVYLRHRHEVEPDAECRMWVVKILARFNVQDAHPDIVRIASRYVGLALEDPDRDVRTAAAQGLRQIGAPSGLLYLILYLQFMKLEDDGTSGAARKEVEEEYNAARLALRALTGRQDLPVGAPTWVPLEQAEANRKGWVDWYDSAAAVPARLTALDDLDTVEDAGPLWPVRYLLTDLARDPSSPRATPPAVYLRSYRLLKRHMELGRATRPQAFAADPKMSAFPFFPEEQIRAEAIPTIQAAMLAYYRKFTQ